MPVAQLSNKDIDGLITVPKYLPGDYRSRLRTRARPYSDRHEEGQLEIDMQDKGTFRVIIRKIVLTRWTSVQSLAIYLQNG